MFPINWRLNNTDRSLDKIYWELVFKIINPSKTLESKIHEKSVNIIFQNRSKIEKWQMCISKTPNPVQPKDMPWWNKTMVDLEGIRKVYFIENGTYSKKYKKEFGNELKKVFIDSDTIDHKGTIQIENKKITIELN